MVSGTGKTTTARKLGQVYYDMGFLSSAEVVECSATDLVGQYVGQTGPKTKGVFEKALGKVLFIDEAYRLAEGHFAKEAMDEIVGLMTSERYINKLIIILAGYDQEMNSLLSVNPGLSSRFDEEILFQNLTPDQCLELLDKVLQKENISVPELKEKASSQYREMHGLIAQMSTLPSWGNGRDVKTLGRRMVQKAYENLSEGVGSLLLQACEVISILFFGLYQQEERLYQQEERQKTKGPLSYNKLPIANFDSLMRPPSTPSISTKGKQSISRPSTSQSSSAEPTPLECIRTDEPTTRNQESLKTDQNFPVEPADSARRDSGVSDEVWNQLQADIAVQEAEKAQASEIERSLQRVLFIADNKIENAKQQEAKLSLSIARSKDGAKKKELEQKLETLQKRFDNVKAQRQRAVEALRKKQQEEAEKRKREKEMQERLAQLARCPMGYVWIKQSDGYRCAGGSHFIGNNELGTSV